MLQTFPILLWVRSGVFIHWDQAPNTFSQKSLIQPFFEIFPLSLTQASLSTTRTHKKETYTRPIMWGQCLTNSVKMQRHETLLSIHRMLRCFTQNAGESESKEREIKSLVLSRENWVLITYWDKSLFRMAIDTSGYSSLIKQPFRQSHRLPLLWLYVGFSYRLY